MPLIVQAQGREDRILQHIIAAIGSTNVSRIGIVMAWVSRPGLHSLRGYLEAQTIGANPTQIDIVLGNNPHMRYSHRSALVDLLEMSTNENINVRITSSLTTFHPKMILVQGPEGEISSHLFVGSANWTGPGLGVEEVTSVNAEIVAYTHNLNPQSTDFLAAMEGLNWFCNDANSFELNQDFIDQYQPAPSSQNPIVLQELTEPLQLGQVLSPEEEEELLAESETIPTTLSIPNAQAVNPEDFNLTISGAIARFLSVIQANADNDRCADLHGKLHSLEGFPMNKSGHVMRCIPVALRFIYECSNRQEVLERIRGLASDATSATMRQAYRTEWNLWLDTFDHNTHFPRVRNKPGMVELTWANLSNLTYFSTDIGGPEGSPATSQAELNSCMYIIAHFAEFENPDQGA